MPVKRPIFRYAALALLFAMTLAYEVRYTRDVLRSERVDVPFFLIETATNRIACAVPEAKRLGTHTGDQVLAIDGVPYTGSSVLGGARAQARPGVPIVLTLRAPADRSERMVSVPVGEGHPQLWGYVGDLGSAHAVSLCRGALGGSRLDVGGTVVGVLESYAYDQGSVSLAAGDILVAYTDGISEAMNAVDEEWGEDRMIATVKQCDGLPAPDILQRILAAADAFVAGAKQHDDMTLVILRAV